MHIKVIVPKKDKHASTVAAIGYTAKDELWSCGDDRSVLKWTTSMDHGERVLELPGEAYPTSMHWFPRLRGAGGSRAQGDIAALGCSDGKFRLVSGNGKIEKEVEAHRGAVISLRWSPDGSALVTVGEDGHVKLWSKSGMHRSTLLETGNAVYACAWSPGSDAVLLTAKDKLMIKPLQPSGKVEEWKAHDGVILTVDWNPINGRIISGGEDRKYKVWDSFGRMMYSSTAHDHPITAVRWNQDGSVFAAAGYNMMRLCDRAGYSHSLHRLPATGSVFGLAWTGDGTELAMGCANGSVLFGQVLGQRMSWRNFEVTVETKDSISVRDIRNNSVETLSDFRDPIVKISMAHGHLIVITAKQGLVYSSINWHTPVVIDLKGGLISFVMQSKKFICIIDTVHGIQLYSYEGRLVSSPKIQNMKPDLFTEDLMAMCDDTIAVRDQRDSKKVHIIDISSGSPIGKPVVHSDEVVEVALDQAEGSLARHLAFVDKNRDVFITVVRKSVNRAAKLGTMVQSIAWHEDCTMLAAVCNGRFSVWYYPSAVFVDPDVLATTRSDTDASEIGMNAQIDSFTGSTCIIRRADGAVNPVNVSPYPIILHEYANARKWNDAIRVCRFVKDPAIWACLAVLAASAKEIAPAEVAYAAIEEIDKVQYLASIKAIPTAEGRNAEMALFCRQVDEAESILLQAGLLYRAISMNCKIFRWERALDLAIKHKTHVDTVVALREKNLARFPGAIEHNRKFKEYSRQIEVDWEQIDAKIEQEAEAERSRPGAVPYQA